jgi:hypothetical protein
MTPPQDLPLVFHLVRLRNRHPPCHGPSSRSEPFARSKPSTQTSAIAQTYTSFRAVQRPEMDPRNRRMPAIKRGQAPRPGLVEDRSSCVHHWHQLRSQETVSSFCIFNLHNPVKKSRCFPPKHRDIFSKQSLGVRRKILGILGEIPRDSGISPQNSVGKFPSFPGKIPGFPGGNPCISRKKSPG